MVRRADLSIRPWQPAALPQRVLESRVTLIERNGADYCGESVFMCKKWRHVPARHRRMICAMSLLAALSACGGSPVQSGSEDRNKPTITAEQAAEQAERYIQE